ncbi:acyl-CoA dehydrogenase family protein [Streptomyces sp. NPDC001848]|uniref:acyl-CoA dehydrogenase family protein n=1 Tax=Streptomyces sp. NPDC001848 TaxID=3364618 RepID=UPI0036C3D3D7
MGDADDHLEDCGGGEARDYRYNTVLAEELAKVNAALSSCLGIHTDIVAPYLVDPTTEWQKRRRLPGFCLHRCPLSFPLLV